MRFLRLWIILGFESLFWHHTGAGGRLADDEVDTVSVVTHGVSTSL
jgi:hypothetical protein